MQNNKNAIEVHPSIIKSASRREIFELVENKQNWKFPTKPIAVKSLKTAKLVKSCIEYYTGGAEIEKIATNRFIVTSKGYYHYIGA